MKKARSAGVRNIRVRGCLSFREEGRALSLANPTAASPMLDRLAGSVFFDDVIRRPPVLYGRYRRFLFTFERWDPSQREELLCARHERVLNLARRIPGYQARCARDDLFAWPILRKADIVGRERDFGTRSRLPAHRASTGGTTGVPLAIRRSPYSILVEQASMDHVCAKAGLDLPGARVAVLRGDFVKPPSEMSPPYWRGVAGPKRIFSSFHLSRRSLPDYLGGFREFAPDVLSCYPSSLQHLVDLLRERGERLRVPFVFTSSECIGPDTIKTAREVLGARVIDYYGQAERVVAAYSIDGNDYHFLPAYGRTELLPDDEGRVRVVGTSLWNDRQVFIRYDTGDFASVASMTDEARCRTELGLAGFRGIDGRSSERIDLADGRRIIGLNHLPRGVPGASSIQFQHARPELVEAFLVPSLGYGDATESALNRNFYAKFPPEIVLKITKIDVPIRSRSGKVNLLIA
jgi:phenylacetate-CoA ligase